jgi:hypothetical protein
MRSSAAVLELPKSRVIPNAISVAFAGIGLYALLMAWGLTVHCNRDTARPECTITEPATFDSVQWEPRSGDIVTDEDQSFSAPRFHTGDRNPRKVAAIIADYERFVADPSVKAMDAHLYTPWALLLLGLPAMIPTLSRLGSRGQRVVFDTDADKMVVHELASEEAHRTFKLSTIEATSIESVDDSDLYEVHADGKAVIRNSKENCDKLLIALTGAIEEAQRKAA